MNRIRNPRVNSKEFVKDIELYGPCHRYYDYLGAEILKPGMTLRDIWNHKHILHRDIIWLLEELTMGSHDKEVTCYKLNIGGEYEVYDTESREILNYYTEDQLIQRLEDMSKD